VVVIRAELKPSSHLDPRASHSPQVLLALRTGSPAERRYSSCEAESYLRRSRAGLFAAGELSSRSRPLVFSFIFILELLSSAIIILLSKQVREFRRGNSRPWAFATAWLSSTE
jgi:hypothetical protein